MAIGDAAAGKDMDLVNGATTPANTIDTEINKTRDYIAYQIDARNTALLKKVDKPLDGGLMARREPGSVHSIGFYTDNASTLFFRPDATTGTYDRKVITQQELDAALAGGGVDSTARATANAAKDGLLNASVYGRTLNGSYRVCYVKDDGTLGWVSSSRRYKKNIKPAEVNTDAVLAMELVTFLYKVEIDTERLAELQHGLIAEDLDALGLDWLVDYGEDGQPEGVRYDRIALALLPVIQRQEQRIAAIEAHLDALGGDLHA